MLHNHTSRWIPPAIILAFVGLSALLLSFSDTGGVDWYYHYHPTMIDFLHSGKLYMTTRNFRGFYDMPWSVYVLAPLAAAGYDRGLAILRAMSLLTPIISTVVFSKPGWGRPFAIALAVCNLYTFDLVFRGQVTTWFLLLPMLLGWIALKRDNPWLMGVALLLLTVKPPNGLPVALLYVYHTRRRWSRVLIIPAAAVAASFIMQPTWIGDWLANYAALEPLEKWKVTLWRTAEVIGLPVWIAAILAVGGVALTVYVWRRKRPGLEGQLLLTLALTFLVSPYTVTYHFEALLGISMAMLLSWRPWLAAPIWLATFTPLLRLILGTENSWVDYLFAVLIFGLSIWMVSSQPDPAPGAPTSGVAAPA